MKTRITINATEKQKECLETVQEWVTNWANQLIETNRTEKLIFRTDSAVELAE